ncbi:MAG: acyltransferase [Limosilactobacillus sp.]|uniref:acyltransferase n=1 Tax=Limosilactobacillus sp. TaxID=2773925 RepID=UPI0026F75F67|nr:acyltransferase [Limosilactobacillus sp.]
MAVSRIKWIDCVRAVAMIMIICTHTYTSPYVGSLLFTVNVPIFFVLSGYLTKQKSIKQTVIKGVTNLVIPYLFTAFLMFMLSLVPSWGHVKGFQDNPYWYNYLLAGLYGIGEPTKQSIFPHFLMPSIGAIWFLIAMYFGNIMFQICLKYVGCDRSLPSTIILLCYGLVASLLGIYISKYVHLPWSLNSALISQFFYVIGYLIRKYNFVEIEIRNIVVCTVALLFCLWAAKYGPFLTSIGFAPRPIINILGATAGSYSLMFIFKLIDLKIQIPLLPKLGHLSMITLCVHIIGLNIFSDVAIVSGKLISQGISPSSVGILMDTYRVLICWIATLILYKSSFARRIFAIR